MSEKVPVITQPDESLMDSIKRAWNSVMSLAPKKTKDVPVGTGSADKAKQIASGRQRQIDQAVKDQGG